MRQGPPEAQGGIEVRSQETLMRRHLKRHGISIHQYRTSVEALEASVHA